MHALSQQMSVECIWRNGGSCGSIFLEQGLHCPGGGCFGLTNADLCQVWEHPGQPRQFIAPKALYVFRTAQRKQKSASPIKIGINIGVVAVSMSSFSSRIQFSVFSGQFCTVLPSIACKGDAAFR